MDHVILEKTDAWVFLAIGAGPFGRTSLTYVMSFLDYLNRTMPTEPEFVASVRRLGAAGFIDVSPKGFKQTRTGGAFFKRFDKPREGVITTMVRLMGEWDGLDVPIVNPNFEFTLKPDEWQSALDDYGARWTKRLAKIRK